MSARNAWILTVGIAALAAVMVAQRLHKRWWMVVMWNALGLADMVLVVVTAGRLAVVEPASMRALAVPPLCLLPLWVVPILIGSHIAILIRLWRSEADAFRRTNRLRFRR